MILKRTLSTEVGGKGYCEGQLRVLEDISDMIEEVHLTKPLSILQRFDPFDKVDVDQNYPFGKYTNKEK